MRQIRSCLNAAPYAFHVFNLCRPPARSPTPPRADRAPLTMQAPGRNINGAATPSHGAGLLRTLPDRSKSPLINRQVAPEGADIIKKSPSTKTSTIDDALNCPSNSTIKPLSRVNSSAQGSIISVLAPARHSSILMVIFILIKPSEPAQNLRPINGRYIARVCSGLLSIELRVGRNSGRGDAGRSQVAPSGPCGRYPSKDTLAQR